MDSIEYGNLDTVEKRAVVLDFFFMMYNEIKEFSFIKPKDLKSKYRLNSNQHRTLSRNFHWLLLKYVIIGESEEVDIDKIYNTSFKLDTSKIIYNIPTDEDKRKHYSYLLASLLNSKDSSLKNIPYYEKTAKVGISFITHFGDGIVRETFLSAKIYDYFKNNEGSLLGIMLELSNHNQPIYMKYKNGDKLSKIDIGVIESIGIYDDESIQLIISGETIEINSIDDITNIFILSKNYPTSKVGLPSMNMKTLVESFKTHKNYNKMSESYIQYCKEFEIEFEDFEKYINKLLKEKANGLTITQRANRRIRRV